MRARAGARFRKFRGMKKFVLRYRWLVGRHSRPVDSPSFPFSKLGRKLAEHPEISPISTALLKEIYPSPPVREECIICAIRMTFG